MLQLPFQELFETYKPAQNTLSEPGLGALGNTQTHTMYNVQFIYQSMVVTRDPSSSLKTPARWKCLGFLVQSIATQVEGANTGWPFWRKAPSWVQFLGTWSERNLYQFMRRISVQLGFQDLLRWFAGIKTCPQKYFGVYFGASSSYHRTTIIIIIPYMAFYLYNEVFITRSNAGHYESKLPAMCSTPG